MPTDRLNHLIDLMKSHHLDALALNAGPSLFYLTGLQFHLSERPAVLLVTPNTAPALIIPDLEAGKAQSASFPVTCFAYGENPASWGDIFHEAVQALILDGRAVGVEPTRMRYLELNLLQAAAPRAKFVSAETALAELRIQKNEDEITAMRKAVEIAQDGLMATLAHFKIGMTERQLASRLSLELLNAGSDSEFPFAPIVAAGPNSANPHAVPTDRPIQRGDLLVIDWGASHNSYFSDLTRTFAIGEIDPELAEIARVVLESNTAGREAARPGIPAGDVDAASRAVIERAGYGPYFFHRTGHGLGLEIHEQPYIFGENSQKLLPGMTFTVEPGIYLPERGGVRIEDNLVITTKGAETLSNLPRPLLTLDSE